MSRRAGRGAVRHAGCLLVAGVLVACGGDDGAGSGPEPVLVVDGSTHEGHQGHEGHEGHDATSSEVVVEAGAAAPAPALGPVDAVDHGARLFADPRLSPSDFNVFACSTCHGTEPDVEPTIAVSLHNTAFRESWWGGDAVRLIDAVNFCLVYFMRGDSFDREDPKGRALYEYLVSISPDRDQPALPMGFVEEIPIRRGGDPARGAEIYGKHCRSCHGEPHTGEGRIGGLVVTIPQGLVEWAAAEGAMYDVDTVPVAPLIVDKIRHGQFFGVGGNMPFFTREILSDEEVTDIVAYLGF